MDQRPVIKEKSSFVKGVGTGAGCLSGGCLFFIGLVVVAVILLMLIAG